MPFLEAHRWEMALPSTLSSFRFDLTMTLPVNPNHVNLLEPFQSKFWISRGWFVQCRLRDRGRFFRLSTVQSPIITILHWPDDELLLGTPTTTVYRHVTHIGLWWNLSKSTYSICPNVRSIQFYGARNANDEPIDPNVSSILQCPSLEHLIINNDLPITHTRFGSALMQSSVNVQKLTCSTSWLRSMFKDERVCLLTTLRIRKLILMEDETVLSRKDIIAFCRTFINLEELTMSLSSIEDFVFLLDNLRQLTMVNIQMTDDILVSLTDVTKWIEENTILRDFVAQKQVNAFKICNIILWIGSHRDINSKTLEHYLKDA